MIGGGILYAVHISSSRREKNACCCFDDGSGDGFELIDFEESAIWRERRSRSRGPEREPVPRRRPGLDVLPGRLLLPALDMDAQPDVWVTSSSVQLLVEAKGFKKGAAFDVEQLPHELLCLQEHSDDRAPCSC